MNNTKKALIALSAVSIAVLGIAALTHAQDSPCSTYYLPAEAVKTEQGVTTFGQVDGEQPTQYLYSICGTYPDNVPYLLSMSTLGTEDPSDDKILVIWLPAGEAPPSSGEAEPSEVS